MKYLLVLFFAIVYEIDASCPNGTFYDDAGDRCYFIPKDSTQFLLAETSCQNQNGNLASIPYISVNYYLKDMAKHILGSNVTYAWLGGRKDINGTWIWSDGQNFSYTHWAEGNPNNYDGDNCMVLRLSNGQWYNINCYSNFTYICELSQTTTVITNSPSTTFTPLSTTDPKHSIYLNLLIFSCVGIFIFIFIAFMLIYCILRYREKKRSELLDESLDTGISSNIYS